MPDPTIPARGTVLLEAKDLHKQFGGLKAVDGVSIQVRAGTLHSIIGPNGAGKTTLFNLLSGVMAPTAGEVYYKGRNITHHPPHRIAHLGIGRSFQITNIFSNLTVLENVRLACQSAGKDNFRIFKRADAFPKYEEKAREVLQKVGLAQRERMYASMLPHGDKRKLELGIMLAGDPDLLLLDEPTAGMSSEQVPQLIEIIKAIMADNDKTVVLVEHRMDMVMNISDWITVMHLGRVLAEGEPHKIASDPLVQQAYLGALYGDFEQLKPAETEHGN